jgi:hypothetical protein
MVWRCVALAKILVAATWPYSDYVLRLDNIIDYGKLEISLREDFVLESD